VEIVSIPLVVTVGVGLLAGLFLVQLSGFRAAQVCVWALTTQLVVAGLPWLVLKVAPERRDWNGGIGDTCPDLDGIAGVLMIGLGFAAAVVGGIVLGSALVAAVKHVARLRGVALSLGAVALPYAAFLPLLAGAFCGAN
jgi:hypothetical protein